MSRCMRLVPIVNRCLTTARMWLRQRHHFLLLCRLRRSILEILGASMRCLCHPCICVPIRRRFSMPHSCTPRRKDPLHLQ